MIIETWVGTCERERLNVEAQNLHIRGKDFSLEVALSALLREVGMEINSQRQRYRHYRRGNPLI